MRHMACLFMLLLLTACGGEGSWTNPPPPDGGSNGDDGGSVVTPPPVTVHTFTWVENSYTQPVPPWGSPVRLSLPVDLDDISFSPLTAIGGFGIHAGGHVEGMDHIWMHVKPHAVIRSWAAGTVTRIEDMSSAGDTMAGEYFITIDYGHGLIGKHMEVETPLVVEGQQVAEGDPVAIGLPWRDERSAEFALVDTNRANEVGYGTGYAVSPFDYLKEEVKQAFVARYIEQVVQPCFDQGLSCGDSKVWEPWLTNRHMLHQNHPGTLIGEWILADRGWAEPEPEYYDMLTILHTNNPWGSFQRFAMLDEALFGPSAGNEGVWELHGTTASGEGRVLFDGPRRLYGLYRVDESAERAVLTIEWRENGWPESLSANAAVYVERAPLPRRGDARELGRMP